MPDVRNCFAQSWAPNSDESVGRRTSVVVLFLKTRREVSGDRRRFDDERTAKADLLWMVDCCRGVPESLLRRGVYFLRISGFLSRAGGVIGIHARSGHRGFSSRIPRSRLALWLAGRRGNRPREI